jgi:hypothetical protein
VKDFLSLFCLIVSKKKKKKKKTNDKIVSLYKYKILKLSKIEEEEIIKEKKIQTPNVYIFFFSDITIKYMKNDFGLVRRKNIYFLFSFLSSYLFNSTNIFPYSRQNSGTIFTF